MNKGFWLALVAYALWGVLPIYWKSLHHVPALELLSHRIVWSCGMLLGWVVLTRQWTAFRTIATQWHTLRVYLVAALLIGVNWLTYVWAVNAGFIVETSLGYFINPLLSVVLGLIFLRERLRPTQWVPIGLATTGVVYLTVQYGALPWIALTLAFSFAFYGLVKKLAPLGSVFGLTLETCVLGPLALGYLLVLGAQGQGAFLHVDLLTDGLLIGAGLVTSVPLLLFAAAAQRIPLTVVGLLQYLAPTLQLLIGVWVYHEPFTWAQLVGFGFVWLALALFVAEGFWARQLARAQTAPGK